MRGPCLQVLIAGFAYEVAEGVSLLKRLHAKPMEIPTGALSVHQDMPWEADDFSDGPLVNPRLLEVALQKADDLGYLGGQVQLDAERQDGGCGLKSLVCFQAHQ